MDPKATYLDMYEAMRDGDETCARTLACILYGWLDAGGFWPSGYTQTEVYGYLCNVFRRTGGMPGGFHPLLTAPVDEELTADGEACPGCGCLPGDGVTPSCTHEHGCGFWKEVSE